MTASDNPRATEKPSNDGGGRRDLAVIVLSVACLIAVMIGSLYYPLPDGKQLGLWSFIALWLREILLVALFVAVLVFVLWRRVVNHFRNSRSQSANAP